MKKILILVVALIFTFLAFTAIRIVTYKGIANKGQSTSALVEITETPKPTKNSQFIVDSDGVQITEEDGVKIEEIMPKIDPSMDGEDDDGIEAAEPVAMLKQDDFQKIKEKNDDVVGWVSVPNTRIEYPVVLTTDNDYYLDHNVEKKNSKAGAIFMDFRNGDLERRRHIILYGHNMKSGSMFHDLTSFKMRNFFEKNKYITFYLDGEAYEYEIYSAFVIDADSGFIRTKFNNDNDFVSYITEFKNKSKFLVDTKISPNDQILTLSTCTYETGDARFVVQAKRRLK